jgi:putative ABC transport system permease protein
LDQYLIVDHDDTVKVLGVVKNFNWSSLQSAHVPVMLWPNKILGQKFSIRLSGNFSESIAHIESLYSGSFPGNPFEYYFLDDFFNAQYKSDRQFGRIFGLFALLAIFIACMGIFGLASFTTAKRFKEISIRKVLGASAQSLVVLLSGQFLRLVVMACAVSLPLTWVAVNSWLHNYAFRIPLSWDLYLLPTVVLIVIALATIIVQVTKAAVDNPVKGLRNE